MPTRVPVLPVSVPVSTTAEMPLEKLKAWLERIRERRSSQTLSQSEPQPPGTQPAPGTPAQQQRQEEQEFSPKLFVSAKLALQVEKPICKLKKKVEVVFVVGEDESHDQKTVRKVIRGFLQRLLLLAQLRQQNLQLIELLRWYLKNILWRKRTTGKATAS